MSRSDSFTSSRVARQPSGQISPGADGRGRDEKRTTNIDGSPSIATSPKAGSKGHGIGRSLSTTSQASRTATRSLQSQNIKVVVRVRPLNEVETARGDIACALTDPDDHTLLQVVTPGPRGAATAREFTFDVCLGPEATQEAVMSMCGIRQLLDAALAGYNVTIFVYGQTGSGKTFTMSGREEPIADHPKAQGDNEEGLVMRAVAYLFERQAALRDVSEINFRASYCEIYNEAMYDLLRFSKEQLAVRYDAVKGFHVPDLFVKQCATVDDMLQVVVRGLGNRRVGTHELNIESSRSHSIFTVHCETKPTSPDDPAFGNSKRSKISFVDLAGSERLKESKSGGEMLKETAQINKSLFTLGKVIASLADPNCEHAHVAYRDSKLTKLLMDSLGGSALTLMIACCSPSNLHLEETLSTLSYATRTKNIQNKPVVQLDEKEAAIAALKREVQLLRAENNFLRSQDTTRANTASSTPLMTPHRPPPHHSPSYRGLLSPHDGHHQAGEGLLSPSSQRCLLLQEAERMLADVGAKDDSDEQEMAQSGDPQAWLLAKLERLANRMAASRGENAVSIKTPSSTESESDLGVGSKVLSLDANQGPS